MGVFIVQPSVISRQPWRFIVIVSPITGGLRVSPDTLNNPAAKGAARGASPFRNPLALWSKRGSLVTLCDVIGYLKFCDALRLFFCIERLVLSIGIVRLSMLLILWDVFH